MGQSADGTQTAGLVIQPFQTVADDVYIWLVRLCCSVKPPLNFASEILLLTYLLIYSCTHLYVRDVTDSCLSLAGLSSFYTQLMQGIGASSRLWELIDRQPSIPLIGMTSHYHLLPHVGGLTE